MAPINEAIALNHDAFLRNFKSAAFYSHNDEVFTYRRYRSHHQFNRNRNVLY